MIEHKPWVGDRYKTGMVGQRIAIMGHAHHEGKDGKDLPDCVNTAPKEATAALVILRLERCGCLRWRRTPAASRAT